MANHAVLRQYSFFAALLVAAFVAPSNTLLAQASPPSPSCAYDQCALRLEGNRILRGASGEMVGKLGLFSATSLSGLVSRIASDSALAHARIFDANYGRGSILFVAGALTGGVALGVAHARSEQRLTGGTSTVFAIALSGLVVELVGARKLVKARNALSRAMWWHNRELAR